MDPATDSTISLRQPDRGGRPAWRGLLRSVCVHESVLARIILQIDNYAPAALPARFDIVGVTGPRGIPALTAKNYATLANAAAESDLRFDHQEEAWNEVWWRRFIYFLTIGTTILLLIAPWTKWLQGVDQLCSDDRCFARSFFDLALFFVPQSIRNSLNPWASVPLDVIFFGLVIFCLIAWGRRTERRFRDRVREIWRDYLRESGIALAPIDTRDRSWLRPERESLIYQGNHLHPEMELASSRLRDRNPHRAALRSSHRTDAGHVCAGGIEDCILPAQIAASRRCRQQCALQHDGQLQGSWRPAEARHALPFVGLSRPCRNIRPTRARGPTTRSPRIRVAESPTAISG